MTPISSSLADQGTHEKQVRAMFPGAFEWRGTAPVYQAPLYILAFTNRSGSNLLADYLRQTGLMRGFGEGLNWDHIERDIARTPTASFPDYITQLAGPPGGTQSWGIKASWDQIVMLQRARIPAMFSGVRIIHTVREDILGQDCFLLHGRARMLALDPGQHGGDMAVLAVKREPTLCVVPGQAGQAALDCRNR